MEASRTTWVIFQTNILTQRNITLFLLFILFGCLQFFPKKMEVFIKSAATLNCDAVWYPMLPSYNISSTCDTAPSALATRFLCTLQVNKAGISQYTWRGLFRPARHLECVHTGGSTISFPAHTGRECVSSDVHWWPDTYSVCLLGSWRKHFHSLCFVQNWVPRVLCPFRLCVRWRTAHLFQLWIFKMNRSFTCHLILRHIQWVSQC